MKTFEGELKPKGRGTWIGFRVTAQTKDGAVGAARSYQRIQAPGYVLARVVERNRTN